jgi:hypothetical protein
VSQRLPALKIAASVQTSTMNRGLKDAEAKVAASAQRMQRARAVMQPTLGALGAGPLGSVLGGIGAAGGGPLALAAGAIAAPILAITKTFESMIEASKGAGEALAKFQATGELAAGMNSVMLERLAAIEARTKGFGEAPGFGAGIAFGTEGRKTLGEEFTAEAKKLPTMVGAYLGKLFTAEGGLTERFSQAFTSALASVAPQGQAQYLEALMRDPNRRGTLNETFSMTPESASAQVRELRKINRNLS